MKREDILAEVRETRPNEYQDEWALKQVDELTERIRGELMAGYVGPASSSLEAEVYGADADAWADPEELPVKSPYHKAYVYWLLAQIDLANSDYDRYNNDLQLFNAAWEELGRYISRTHKRARPSVYKVW